MYIIVLSIHDDIPYLGFSHHESHWHSSTGAFSLLMLVRSVFCDGGILVRGSAGGGSLGGSLGGLCCCCCILRSCEPYALSGNDLQKYYGSIHYNDAFNLSVPAKSKHAPGF